jgi:hypothetical protein
MEHQVSDSAKESVVGTKDAAAIQRKSTQHDSSQCSSFPHLVQQLHAISGNRDVGRRLQAKLRVGAPNDAYEQEADRVADRVMRMSSPGIVQRRCSDCDKEEEVQRKDDDSNEGMTLQREVAGGSVVARAPSIVNEVLGSAGHPLDASVRTFMEPRFGYDFGGVRVHSDARAAQSARAVNAMAYTVGSDVAFDTNRFAPETAPGRRLLAHELTHVVQQSGGGRMLQRAENDTVPNCAALTDSETDVNDKINSSLKTARAGAGTPPTGLKVIEGVYKDLATNSRTNIGRSAIEVWASSLPVTKSVLPAQSATKYAGVTYQLWSTPFDILNPTMKVSGICIGSDKLGHFFQQGATFWQTAALQGTAAAEEQSERSEGGGFGLLTTGVFSNADREANRQGAKFYVDLLASPTMTFAIKNYISSAWSEVDHPNYYEGSVGHQVWANTLTGSWDGHSWDKSPFADNPLSVSLVATVAGKVTGTFKVGGVTGKLLNGVIRYDTTKVRATSAFGKDTTETPISGIHIDFDWTLGADSGKGFLDSGGERHLGGGWGRGSSNSDRGTWYIDHA